MNMIRHHNKIMQNHIWIMNRDFHPTFLGNDPGFIQIYHGIVNESECPLLFSHLIHQLVSNLNYSNPESEKVKSEIVILRTLICQDVIRRGRTLKTKGLSIFSRKSTRVVMQEIPGPVRIQAVCNPYGDHIVF
jgi:hypothetical protein